MLIKLYEQGVFIHGFFGVPVSVKEFIRFENKRYIVSSVTHVVNKDIVEFMEVDVVDVSLDKYSRSKP